MVKSLKEYYKTESNDFNYHIGVHGAVTLPLNKVFAHN